MTSRLLLLLSFFLLGSLWANAQTDEPDQSGDEETADTTGVVVSHIEIPNGISPNGDGRNDVLRVKADKTKGIVEFRAIVYNRWGQKIYEWTDLDGGWDGNWNGHPAKQGTYFVLVKAKGSDGREHTIKRDVNLLRGFLNDEHQ